MIIARRTLMQFFAAAAQEHSHPAAPSSEPAPSAAAAFFNAAQEDLLRDLCNRIVPPEDGAGGAVEAGAPQLAGLLASENPEYARQLTGGLAWVDSWCRDRYGSVFLDCEEKRKVELLDRSAYRENIAKDATLAPGVRFFAVLRDLALDAYFTSRLGIAYLEFRGNTAQAQFDGCPGGQA